MIGIAPSAISNPVVLAGFAVAGWVLWRRFQRVLKNGDILSMGGWLFQFAFYAGLLMLFTVH